MSLGSVISVNDKGSMYIGVVSERIYPGGATLVGLLENRNAVKITGSNVEELNESITLPMEEYTLLQNQVIKPGTYLVYVHGVPTLVAIICQTDMFQLIGKKRTLVDRGLKEYICILSDTEYLTESTLKELETKMIEENLYMVYLGVTCHYNVVLNNMVQEILNRES